MPKKTNSIRDLAIALILPLIGAATMSHPSSAQTQPAMPTTTGVLVILTAKSGVTREQVMAVMPAEVRATVQLYIGGKIREWFSRARTAAEPCSCSTRRTSARRRRSWTACHWPNKASWTTSTYRSVRFSLSGCSSPTPDVERRLQGERRVNQ
jgi:16S rRNA G1207 methylase RsmC